MAYDVFISYSRKDTEIVNRIEEEINKYDISCFIDRSGIDLGSDFAEIIAKSIYECEIMLFVWSENSNQSENTANEIALAIEFEKIIIPFKIGTFKAHYKLAYRLVRFNRIDVLTINESQIIELAKKIAKQLSKSLKAVDVVDVVEPQRRVLSKPDIVADINDPMLEMSYLTGKQALLKFDLNDAFGELLDPALNDYKDSRVLLSRIVRGRTRLFKVDSSRFDYVLDKADEGNSYAQYIMARYYLVIEHNNDKAFVYAEKSAEQNCAYGLSVKANMYDLGLGTSKDNKIYLKCSREAISLNDCGAMLEMGRNYLYGWTVPKNINMGIGLINKSVELGDPASYNELGDIYWRGVFVERDIQKAEELIRKSIEMGHIEAYEQLGMLYQYDPVTFANKDERKGFEYYMKGAEYSEANCMFRMASSYHYGTLGNENINYALKWYKKAAEAGSRYSCNMIGYIYYYAEGDVSFDPKLAWKWFKKGAASQCNSCLHMLGVMCMDDFAQDGQTQIDAISYFEESAFLGGYGGELSMLKLYDIYNGDSNLSVLVAKDQAIKWLKKAADKNSADACFKYGKILSDISSPYSNELKAVKYLKYAAENGINEAALFLGKLYIHGKAIMKDWDKAKEMLTLAAEKGGLAEAYCELGKLYSHANHSEWDYNDDDDNNDDDDKENNDGVELTDEQKAVEEQKMADNIRAKEYFEKAASMEYAEAYLRLAELESENLDFDDLANGESGRKYFELTSKAAQLNYPQAILDMGVCFQVGVGTSIDIASAIEWYEKSAKYNNEHAMCNIGELFRSGEDVIKDDFKAYYWYKRALLAGANAAEEHITSLKTEFNSRVAEIEKLLDKSRVDQFVKCIYNQVPSEYWAETDAVYREIYAPCIEFAKNKEILDTAPAFDNNSDVVYINKNSQDILNSWKDLCEASTAILKYTPSPIYAENVYPYCSDKFISELRCKLVKIWFDLKPKYTKLKSISFEDDEKILDLAEVESDDMLQLLLIALVENKLSLETAEISNRDVFNLYNSINDQKNENREENILELAEKFYTGKYVNRSYAVAKYFYNMIPENNTAKERLNLLKS